MIEVTMVSFVLNLAYLSVGILVMFAVLRALDKIAKGGFRAAINEINKDPLAAAIYYSARILAIALVGAAFIGA